MDRRLDILMAVAVSAFGAFVLYATGAIRPAAIYDPIGSRGGPLFVGLALLLGGLVVAAVQVVNLRKFGRVAVPDGVEDDPGVEAGTVRRSMALWAVAFAYVLVMPYAGYLLATPAFVAAGLYVMNIRRPAMLAGLAVAFTLPVFLVFTLFLNVRLPSGVLDAPLRQLGLV